jgi:hypothetical protein
MKSWIKFGVGWGIFMFLMMNVIFPLFDKKEVGMQEMLISFPLWLMGGLLFGYVSRGKNTSNK